MRRSARARETVAHDRRRGGDLHVQRQPIEHPHLHHQRQPRAQGRRRLERLNMTSTNAVLTLQETPLYSDRESRCTIDPASFRTATEYGAFLRRVARAGVRGAHAVSLSDVWHGFVHGGLRVEASYASDGWIYLLARQSAEHTPLSALESSVVFPVLCGEQQKAVAVDLHIAPSTASHRYAGSLRKFGIRGAPVPLPLVLAAHHAAGIVGASAADVAQFEHDSSLWTVLVVRRPELRSMHQLTAAQREVASLFIEGHSRSAIARLRRTSATTAAGQIHSTFEALGVSGRYSLIRRAGEMGCFAGLGAS
jgi:DNA-binding NarL/FixJ family response regulator